MPTASASPASRPKAAAVVVAVLLFGFSMRTAVASLSPILDDIGQEIALSAPVVGMIGAAPLVCFGVFGMMTPFLTRRLGLEPMAVSCTGAVVVGLMLRGLALNGTGLLLSTLLIFAAVGAGNVLLPPLVKKYFPTRVGTMTGIYTSIMAVATFLPALLAVPIAIAAGWRMSLAWWSVFAIVALVPWIRIAVSDRAARAGQDVERADPRVLRRLWSSPLAWALTVAFAATSVVAYTSFAWLPRILADIAAVTPVTAGALLSLFAAMSLPISLLVPIVVDRFGGISVLFAIAVLAGFSGALGLLLAPQAATWLWVALLGLAPILFPLVVVQLSLRTRTHQTTVALSAMVQSVGYAIAALGPLAVGVLHDVFGDWKSSLVLLALVLLAAVPAGAVMVRGGTVESEWERRHGTW